MRFTRCATLISLASTAAALALPTHDQPARIIKKRLVARSSEPEYVPGSYIIEFENASAMKKRGGDGNDHGKAFLVDLQKTLKVDVLPGKTFDSQVFEGIAVTIQPKNGEDQQNPEDEMALIQKIPGVKSVSLDRIVPMVDGDSIEAVGNDAVEKRPKWSTHTKSGVEALHKKGIKGAGATVCIVDSGIDYHHAAFAGRFKGGYDVTLEDPLNPKYNDPMECSAAGHGTHVAGIAAGSDSKFVGVAPEADIRAYKVFACQKNGKIKSARDSHIIKAFELAAKDKCDVVNLSIGFYGEASLAITEAIEKLKIMGILVVISAGNEGDYGPFYANGFAMPKAVLAVGSTEHDQDLKYTATAIDEDDNKIEIPIQQVVGSGFTDSSGNGLSQALPVVHYPNPCQQNKGPLMNNEDRRFKMQNKVALIPWGKCDDKIVAIEIQSQGGNNIIFYTDHDSQANFGNPLASPNAVDGELNWGTITLSDAKKIMAMKGAKISFDGQDPEGHDAHSSAAGHMATSSTWGPTYDGRMKPDISAPGGMIFSAWPKKLGNYAVVSGTSMSAPYAAGVAALAVAEDKKKNRGDPLEYVTNLKARMIASGQFVNWYDGKKVSKNLFAPTAQQGNGGINAVLTVDPPALVNLPVLTMSTTPQSQNFKLTVENPTDRELTYTITHVPAVTFDTFSHSLFSSADIVPAFPPNLEKPVAQVILSTGSIKLKRGGYADVDINITPPTGVSAKQVPVYGGKILITASDNAKSSISVPYIGIASSMKENITPINPKSVKFTNAQQNRPLKANDKFEQMDFTAPEPPDQINLEFNVDFWSPELDMYMETVPEDRTKQAKAVDITRHPAGLKQGRDSPADSNKDRQAHPNKIAWKGENEAMLPSALGMYRMVVKALKPTGDKKKDEDWQVFYSPVFEVVPAA